MLKIFSRVVTLLLMGVLTFIALWLTQAISGLRLADAQDVNLVFAIDHSSSMKENDPMNLRFSFSGRLIKRLEGSRVKVAVLLWGGTVKEEVSVNLSSDLSSIVQHLDELLEKPPDYIEYTNLNAAINGIINELDKSEQGDGRTVGILLSDGEGQYSDQSSKKALDKGYMIHTIGLAIQPGSSEEDNLRSIADITGGNYFYAPHDRFLGDILNLIELSVRGNDITKLLKEKPTSIRLYREKLATMVGQSINIDVYIVNPAKITVAADRTYNIKLHATEAEVHPSEVIIPEGGYSAGAKVYPKQPGEVNVSASNTEQSLNGDNTNLFGCSDGNIDRLGFTTHKEQVPVGESISFSVMLTDNQGNLIRVKKPKAIEFKYVGVGWMEPPSTVFISRERCECYVIEKEINSNSPGMVKVTASLGTIDEKQREFSFFYPLWSKLLLFILIGGIFGAFVRSGETWSKSKQWSYVKWSIHFVSGMIGGLCLYLAYKYGLTNLFPKLIGGIGFGFLLGLIGGYMGPTAIDRISTRILPSTKC